MIDSVKKYSKFVRMYPEPFVRASAILFLFAGLTGTVLSVLMPIPVFILAFGVAVWVLQDELANQIRFNPVEEILGEMSDMMEEVENS